MLFRFSLPVFFFPDFIFVRIFICSFVLFGFLLVSFSGFGIRIMLSSCNEFRNVPSFSIFWKRLRRIDVNSSCKCLVESSSEACVWDI